MALFAPVVVVCVVLGVGSRAGIDVGEGPEIRGGSREHVAEDDLVDDHDAEVVEDDGELHGDAGGVAAETRGARGVRARARRLGGAHQETHGGAGDDVHGDEREDAAEDAEDAEGVRDGHDARADDGAGEVEHRRAGLLPGVGMGNALVVRGVPRPPELDRALLHPAVVVRVDADALIDRRGRHGDVTGVRSL